MEPIKEGDEVILNTNVFDDTSRWRNHHLYKRIIAEGRTGIVQEWDKKHSQWWVKFHGATIRFEERNLIKVVVE